MKKIFLFFSILIIVSGMSFAVDFTHGPASVKPGNMLISGGINTGRFSFIGIGASMYGVTLALDYALENYGLTVGGEIGYSSGSVWFFNFGTIPFMGRLGCHPDFGFENTDLYGLFKIGFAMGFSGESSLGFGIGFGIGGRYFFSDNIGAFAELGLDSYFFNDITGRKFFTLGITYKM